MTFYGPSWPLATGTEDTFQRIDNVEAQISFYLRTLLLTYPGENLSDFEYGIGIKKYLFDTNNQSTLSMIKSNIVKQIGIYLSYINVIDVIISSSNSDIDNSSISVKIIYRLPNNINQVVFNLEVNNENTVGFY